MAKKDKYPLAPTLVATAAHISNGHMNFLLEKQGSDLEIKTSIAYSCIFIVWVGKNSGRLYEKSILDSRRP